MPRPPLRTPPCGWSLQGSLHLSLFWCFLSACSTPSLLPPFLKYSYIWSIHLTGGLPLTLQFSTLLLSKHMLHKLILFYSHHNVMPKPSHCAVLHPFNHTLIHSLCRFPHHTIIVLASYYTSFR